MAAHRKLDVLRELRPDVVVLAECASPRVPAAQPVYAAATTSAWVGTHETKGLAVLTFGAWTLRALPQRPGGRLATAVVVDGPTPFHLLALWTQSPGYVEQAHAAVDTHTDLFFAGPTVVAGDLNSNRIFDREHAPRNHSTLVERLTGLGLFSAYHEHYGEPQGAETRPTQFQYRHAHRPFHLDYVFLPKEWGPALRSVDVGHPGAWLAHSDHMPVVVEADV